jgi:nicotinamide phosphoribosyltransferase
MSMSMASPSIIRKTDSYKVGHWRQYPPDTTGIYSYFESRGGDWPESVFFGLQYILDQHLTRPVTQADIDTMRPRFQKHFRGPDIFNYEGWMHILEVHGGRLPISIRAVPEGTPVWNRNVLMTVENTDRKVPWLTSYVETILSHVWYPTTVCTQSRELKKIWKRYLELSGDPATIDFKLHDFGYRGCTCEEQAAIGGAAHLVNFKGTDNWAGIEFAEVHYGADMPGLSIPAAEHSTITAWGKDREAEAYENMMKKFKGAPLIAVVSDSYDIFNAVSEIWGEQLREQVLNFGGTIVIRPDSGKPDEIAVSVTRRLAEKFGCEVNSKGYKLLHPAVRVIQGDGIDRDTLPQVLEAMVSDGWSVDNLVMGSGGGLLQKMNRDTQNFAIKASAIETDGHWCGFSKTPVTDPGKRSKEGRLKLVRRGHGWETVSEDDPGEDQLEEVYRNGSILIRHTWDDVVKRAAL